MIFLFKYETLYFLICKRLFSYAFLISSIISSFFIKILECLIKEVDLKFLFIGEVNVFIPIPIIRYFLFLNSITS